MRSYFLYDDILLSYPEILKDFASGQLVIHQQILQQIQCLSRQSNKRGWCARWVLELIFEAQASKNKVEVIGFGGRKPDGLAHWMNAEVFSGIFKTKNLSRGWSNANQDCR